MEMWSVKMTAAGNPPFVAELAMGKVSYQNTVQLMTFLEDKKKTKGFNSKGTNFSDCRVSQVLCWTM